MPILRSSWSQASDCAIGENTPTGLDVFLEDTGHTTRELPAIAGQYKGKQLVICADAIGVWDDLKRFGCDNHQGRGYVWKSGWQFMTVNKLVETFPGEIEHCY